MSDTEKTILLEPSFNLKTELKKLNEKERIKILEQLKEEEFTEQEEELKKTQCPLTTKLNNVLNELQEMRAQINSLKYEFQCCKMLNNNECESVNNCMKHAIECSMNTDDKMESLEECSLFSMNSFPFWIFLVFILISILMKPPKFNNLIV